MRTVAVVQARMGSTRLPGKVMEPIGQQPLVLWTLAALAAVIELDHVVVATTSRPDDDELAAFVGDRAWEVHRGPDRDVLTRCWEAVAPSHPEVIVRATADNPFVDPLAVTSQIRRLADGGFDYVGPAGWPLGIAVEVARADSLEIAYREATDPAEREHVMPFLYTRPRRFRIGTAPPTMPVPLGRFTVDTADDLAFARAIEERLDPAAGPPSLATLGAILAAEPELLELNRAVRQKDWKEAER
jgi:spore coat polysaccharide biosynthesis protein SpsF (cytidylyltransferase family)